MEQQHSVADVEMKLNQVREEQIDMSVHCSKLSQAITAVSETVQKLSAAHKIQENIQDKTEIRLQMLESKLLHVNRPRRVLLGRLS